MANIKIPGFGVNIGTGKFTVDVATGNTAIAGTLGVTGAATVTSGQMTLSSTATGDVNGLIISRSAGTVSTWEFYLPTASTDMRVVSPSGADKFIFTAAGGLKLAEILELSAAATARTGSIIGLGGTTQTTIGANGAASALTANPLGYLIFFKGATKCVLPYYNG